MSRLAFIISFVLVLFTLPMTASAVQAIPAACQSSVGWDTQLDAYAGEAIHSNGIPRCDHGDSYGYGQKWQCVELAQRYFADKWQIWPGGIGHAVWPNAPKSAYQMFANPPSGVEPYDNDGKAPAPVAGDLLVFDRDTGGGWFNGHVAVITGVSQSAVDFAQQNVTLRGKEKPRDSLRISQGDLINDHGIYPHVLGWLHATANKGDMTTPSSPGPTRAGPTSQTPPTPSPAPPPPEPVTNVDWRNREYQLDCAGIAPKPFRVQVTDGQGVAQGSGDIDRFEIAIQAVATGDLTRDGQPEAAVLVYCSPQPSNYYRQEVQVFTAGPQLLAKLPELQPLPDGLSLLPIYDAGEFSIKQSKLVTGAGYYAATDSHASGPSVHRVLMWRWNGRGFTS
jgi:hypothetical protein